jgi:hypothetical protein
MLEFFVKFCQNSQNTSTFLLKQIKKMSILEILTKFNKKILMELR